MTKNCSYFQVVHKGYHSLVIWIMESCNMEKLQYGKFYQKRTTFGCRKTRTEQHQFYHTSLARVWLNLAVHCSLPPYSGSHLKIGMLKDSRWYHIKIIVVVQQTSIHHNRIITFIYAITTKITALNCVGYHCYHPVLFKLLTPITYITMSRKIGFVFSRPLAS